MSKTKKNVSGHRPIFCKSFLHVLTNEKLIFIKKTIGAMDCQLLVELYPCSPSPLKQLKC